MKPTIVAIRDHPRGRIYEVAVAGGVLETLATLHTITVIGTGRAKPSEGEEGWKVSVNNNLLYYGMRSAARKEHT